MTVKDVGRLRILRKKKEENRYSYVLEMVCNVMAVLSFRRKVDVSWS